MTTAVLSVSIESLHRTQGRLADTARYRLPILMSAVNVDHSVKDIGYKQFWKTGCFSWIPEIKPFHWQHDSTATSTFPHLENSKTCRYPTEKARIDMISLANHYVGEVYIHLSTIWRMFLNCLKATCHFVFVNFLHWKVIWQELLLQGTMANALLDSMRRQNLYGLQPNVLNPRPLQFQPFSGNTLIGGCCPHSFSSFIKKISRIS